jgi:colanic acid biosynthesis glycosyl transferase WcaI
MNSKVVFVNRYFSPDESATSRMLSDLTFRLSEQGVSVGVVTSRQLYENPRADLPEREEIHGVCVHRVNTAKLGRARLAGRAIDYASFHVAAGVELMRWLEPGDVVVAKTDPPLISVVVSVAARWRRAVLINWLQDLFPEVAAGIGPRVLPGWAQRTLLAARDRSLRSAAANIVLSEGMRTRLTARGLDSSSIHTIPNWADVSRLVPMAQEESRTRRRLGLGGTFVVGYSGNLGRAHEFDTLLGAACLLRDDPQIVFLMTGAGAKSGSLREAVDSEGLPNFLFQDYQPPEMLSDSLGAADVHLVSLLPQLEGLIVPSKIYGILAAGRATVFIGDTDGDLARLVKEHRCGVAVPAGNSARLASELRALRDDPDGLTAMGKRARDLAVSRYSSARAAADWVRVLASVAPQVVGRSPAIAVS